MRTAVKIAIRTALVFWNIGAVGWLADVYTSITYSISGNLGLIGMAGMLIVLMVFANYVLWFKYDQLIT